MDWSREVIGAAIEVHRALGPGLLESAYQKCLCYELSIRGIGFVAEVPLPLEYKAVRLDAGYRVDLLVDGGLVIEVKSISGIEPIHLAQLLTYMKIGGWPLGLLINFNVPVLREGLRRMILTGEHNQDSRRHRL